MFVLVNTVSIVILFFNTSEGVCSVTVIVDGNGPGDSSSNGDQKTRTKTKAKNQTKTKTKTKTKTTYYLKPYNYVQTNNCYRIEIIN